MKRKRWSSLSKACKDGKMNTVRRLMEIGTIIDQSLVYSMLIYPSSFELLSPFLLNPISDYHQLKNYFNYYNEFGSLLIRMNPILLENSEEEKEINSILQNDDLDLLKSKFINNLLDPKYKKIDGRGSQKSSISLIEKCVFFDSKRCLAFLLDENVPISRHRIHHNDVDYEIGLMEYAILKGRIDIFHICLEEGQSIQRETIILGLMGHQNETIKMIIEERHEKKIFDIMEQNFMGITDNILFNERIFESGINDNTRDNDKRRKNKI